MPRRNRAYRASPVARAARAGRQASAARRPRARHGSPGPPRSPARRRKSARRVRNSGSGGRALRDSSRVVRGYADREFANALDAGADLVAGLYRPDAFGGAAEDQVAGMQGVEAGRVFDQPRHVEDHAARVGALPRLAVDREPEIERVGVGHLVAGDEPGREHAVAVDRLAEARKLGPAQGHVEADRVAADVVERPCARHAIRLAPDDYGELDLVVVAPL